MSTFPRITAILPVRNEAKYIRTSLEAVLHQDYPQDRIELLVVDGMSSDETRAIVRGYQQQYSNLKLIDNPGKIVPTGMNTALRAAQGEIIIRVDGHCEIAPDYISNCVQHIQQDHVDGVGGSMHTIGETPLARTIAVAMSSVFGVGDSAFRTEMGQTRFVDSVPFPAYTREIIQKAGLYDEELVRNQDDEYNYRLRSLGAKLLLAADIKSKYYSRGSLRKLWKQYYQYGYWKVRVLQKHPRQMRPRQFAPPVLAVSLLAALGLSLVGSLGRWLLVAVVGSYLLVNLSASLITAKKTGWRHLPLLPIIYIILHLSYGIGFLIGFVKFANRWGDKQGQTPSFENINA